MLRTLTVVPFILFFFPFALAQKPGLIFHQISVNDGLSENSVRSISEGKDGFMWFGTEDGLNKYDGYKFTVYRKNNTDPFSISHSSIKLFYTDSKKNLWVLTADGLNIYDPVLGIFYNYRNNKYPALKPLSGEIEDVIEDKKGNIWVASKSGLYRINSFYQSPKKYNFLSNHNNKLFYSIVQDTDTTLWIGTRDGLLKFNTETETFTDVRKKYGHGYEVRRIYKDEKGNIWLATTNGLKIISHKGDMKEYFHSPFNQNSIHGNNVIEIIPYKNGNYLIAIDGGGIDYFDAKKRKFYHYTDENESQLSNNNIISLYKDSKGDIWAGTYLNGINFSNETTNLFVFIKNNPYSNKAIQKGIVSKFLKDSKGNLWVATDGGGLYKKKKGSLNYIHYRQGDKGLSSNSIISLMEDPEGYIWLTTYGGGICRYDFKKDLFKNYTFDPSKPYTLSNNKTKAIWSYQEKIWVSTYGTGISVFNKKSDHFLHYRYDKFYPQSIPSDWIMSPIINEQGDLWMGSYNGISKYESETNTFKNYLFQSKLENAVDLNSICELIEDKVGNLWLGTTGGGLILFRIKDGSYEIFTTKDGLSNNYIKSIIEDNDSNLWISTNNGITKFNTITKKGKAYTIKDGVPPCSFFSNSKYKDEQGRIYFGANNGYVVIDPKMTGENKTIPPIVITELKIFNEPIFPGGKNSPLKADISHTKEMILQYDQNSFTFEFSALNFNSSQNNKYAFWLEGFDKDWVAVGSQRTATYTNLNPGKYTFHVKGSNNDNIWNEDGVFINIVITPPFWQTWWFNTLAVSFLILLLYLLYTWRLKSIRSKNSLLEETVKQRTSELKEANEQLETFVYKASHDIKGPLRSIIGLTTIGKKDVTDSVALNYFDHILKSTKKLDTLLRDLLEVTKVKQATIQTEKIKFNELVSEALGSFENFPGYTKMKFDVNIKENTEFYSDRKLLYSLIQNLIENPIKYADFSKPENNLSISITVSEKGVDLIFKDNGIGIPQEHQKKVFDMFYKVNDNPNGTGLGLYIVKTTVEKLGGTIHMESSLGKGSSFYVKL